VRLIEERDRLLLEEQVDALHEMGRIEEAADEEEADAAEEHKE